HTGARDTKAGRTEGGEGGPRWVRRGCPRVTGGGGAGAAGHVDPGRPAHRRGSDGIRRDRTAGRLAGGRDVQDPHQPLSGRRWRAGDQRPAVEGGRSPVTGTGRAADTGERASFLDERRSVHSRKVRAGPRAPPPAGHAAVDGHGSCGHLPGHALGVVTGRGAAAARSSQARRWTTTPARPGPAVAATTEPTSLTQCRRTRGPSRANNAAISARARSSATKWCTAMSTSPSPAADTARSTSRSRAREVVRTRSRTAISPS